MTVLAVLITLHFATLGCCCHCIDRFMLNFATLGYCRDCTGSQSLCFTLQHLVTFGTVLAVKCYASLCNALLLLSVYWQSYASFCNACLVTVVSTKAVRSYVSLCNAWLLLSVLSDGVLHEAAQGSMRGVLRPETLRLHQESREGAGLPSHGRGAQDGVSRVLRSSSGSFCSFPVFFLAFTITL